MSRCRRARSAALAALAGLALGCDRVPATAVTSCDTRIDVSVATDILFVVDDSGSMGPKQQGLKANLAAFIDQLASSPVRNDFQVGVTNTSVSEYVDMGGGVTYGSLSPVAGVPYPAGRLVAVDPRALTNDAYAGVLLYDPSANGGQGAFAGRRILAAGSSTLVDDFKTNVRVGTFGSGKEQPLRAARAALTTWAASANQGFLRPGARLAIVILTDEDDCSETATDVVTFLPVDQCHTAANKVDATTVLDKIADFATFVTTDLAARKPIVAVIAGVDPTTYLPALCSTPCPAPNQNVVCAQAYDPADRLRLLYDALPADQRYIDSICNLDYGPALTNIAQLLVPKVVPLQGTPPDWRMLSVGVTKANGTYVACPVALAGSAGAATAGVVFTPPQAGAPATLTFQGPCTLQLSDHVDVKLVCAG